MKTFSEFLSEQTCSTFTEKQFKDLETFGDRLLDKFGIDIAFTRHFKDRMTNDRNRPCITIAEIQGLFKKIAKKKAQQIKQMKDPEAVLHDLQKDLNIPIVVNMGKEELLVKMKTIMRKKDFKSPDPKLEY